VRGRIPTGKQIQIPSAFNREIVLDGSLFCSEPVKKILVKQALV